MKKAIRTVALIAVLGTMTIGCQKETFTESPSVVSENVTIYKVQYSIDGIPHTEILLGERAWSEFLNRMLLYAEQGHEVVFSNGSGSIQDYAAKEVVTYTTTVKEEAYTWCDKMAADGYTVRVTYDPLTGIYTCTAIK